MTKYAEVLFFICFLSCVNAVSQQAEGQVADKLTGEPIAFANVVYSRGAGTVTDIDGRFSIRTDKPVERLNVSCIGYVGVQVALDSLGKGNVIYLLPLKYRLPAVDVMPGNNPALAVMNKVIENKSIHNPELYKPFSCIIYHKMTLDVSGPPS